MLRAHIVPHLHTISRIDGSQKFRIMRAKRRNASAPCAVSTSSTNSAISKPLPCPMSMMSGTSQSDCHEEMHATKQSGKVVEWRSKHSNVVARPSTAWRSAGVVASPPHTVVTVSCTWHKELANLMLQQSPAARPKPAGSLHKINALLVHNGATGKHIGVQSDGALTLRKNTARGEFAVENKSTRGEFAVEPNTTRVS